MIYSYYICFLCSWDVLFLSFQNSLIRQGTTKNKKKSSTTHKSIFQQDHFLDLCKYAYTRTSFLPSQRRTSCLQFITFFDIVEGEAFITTSLSINCQQCLLTLTQYYWKNIVSTPLSKTKAHVIVVVFFRKKRQGPITKEGKGPTDGRMMRYRALCTCNLLQICMQYYSKAPCKALSCQLLHAFFSRLYSSLYVLYTSSIG